MAITPWVKGSASQVETFDLCIRKWYYDARLKIPRVSGPGAELGTLVHAKIEDYLLNGKLPDEKKLLGIIRPGLQYLPPAASVPKNRIEVKFELMAESLPVKLSGIIDWLWQEENTVGDNKTLKDFKYMKTEGQLARDTQGVSYVGEAHLELGWQFPIKFRHVYFCTSKSDSEMVETTFTKTQWEDRFAALGLKLANMKTFADAEIDDIPFPKIGPGKTNPEACGAFGGCPFIAICFGQKMANANNRAVLSSLFSNKETVTLTSNKILGDKMGFKDKLIAMQNDKSTPAAAAVIEIMAEDISVDAETLAALDALEEKQTQKQIPIKPLVHNGDIPRYDPRSVNPPDGTEMDLVTEHVDKKAKTKAAPATPAAPAATPAATPAAPVAQASYPFYLFINCRPRQVPVFDLAEVLSQIQEDVAEDAGVPHYGLLEYNNGNKRVAAMVAHKLKNEGHEWLPEYIMADRRFPGTDAVLEILVAYKDKNDLAPFIVDKLG